MPALVTMFTVPPPDRPNSAEYVDVSTRNSCTESCGGTTTTPLKSPTVLAEPSSKTSFVDVRPPLTEKLESNTLREPRAPPTPPAAMTPGIARTSPITSRSSSGKSCTVLVSIVVPTPLDSVCSSGTSAVTSTAVVTLETCRAKSAVTVWLISSLMSLRICGCKPAASTKIS